MQSIFTWLGANPYILLFGVVAGAVLLGKVTVKGYGFGMVASAIIVGAAVSAVMTCPGTMIGKPGG